MTEPARQLKPRPVVRALPFQGDEEAMLAALVRKEPPAVTAFCQRYADHVRRVLARVLGASDPDLPDVHQEVLLRAIRSADQVESAAALKGWVTIIAVNAARNVLTRRQRWRWLSFMSPTDLPEVSGPVGVSESSEALRRLYAILDDMKPDDRIAFSLRFLEQMELTEVAAACDTSLATIKRRIARAEERFVGRARNDGVLSEWLERGGRWS